MKILNQRIPSDCEIIPNHLLALTAEERSRSRYQTETTTREPVYLHLPRGTVLRDGDWLQADDGTIVQVIAKPEPILTVTSNSTLGLLQAAYHLGNRHVPVEITASYLRLSPDPVLQDLLLHRGLHVVEELVAFYPEVGAYGSHSHAH